MSNIIDYNSTKDWAINIETLVLELIRNDQSATSLILASLLMDKKDRNEIFGNYIQKSIPKENPLFTLLMI